MGDSLFDIAGRAVYITGCGGIGAALAAFFLRRGARVTLGDCDGARLAEACAALREADGEAIADVVDLRCPDAVAASFARAEARLGAFDVLLHTAAVASNAPAVSYDPAAVRRIVEVDLLGTIWANQAACRIMERRGGGKIVNFGSIAGAMAHTYASMPYEACKAAVHQVTRSFAVAAAPFGVRVNAIAPGWVRTPMCEGKAPSIYEGIARDIPLGRWARPEDICGMALFLSTAASDYCTGQVYFVDGGWAASKAAEW